MNKLELKLDWCSDEAARYAVENWHYSRKLPFGKHARVGVWEAGRFVGAVVFSYGSNKNIGKPYGLTQSSCCELIRVALGVHASPVSRVLAVAVRLLKRLCPGLRLIVSYADPDQGHHGGIYQACGWIYTGQSKQFKVYKVGGISYHQRSVGPCNKWQPKSLRGMNVRKLTPILRPGKHRYLMPLDDEIRARVEPLRKPYPRRAGSVDSCTPADQAGRGGANPTSALPSP